MFWVCISKYLPVPLTELFVVERTVCVQVDLFMLTHTGCKIAVTISTGFNIRWNRFSILITNQQVLANISVTVFFSCVQASGTWMPLLYG